MRRGRIDAALAEHIEADRDQDDDAAGEGLVVRRNPDQRLPLGEHGDERCAEERADQRSAPAEKAGAADDDGGDHVEFLAEPGLGSTGLEARGEDDAGERRAEAGDDVSGDLDAGDPDAGQPCREFAAAERVEIETEARPAEDQGADDQEDGEDQERQRNAVDVLLPENEESLVRDHGAEQVLGIRVIEREADPPDHVKRRECHDKGRDAEPRDQEAVDRAGDAADEKRDRHRNERAQMHQPDQVVDDDAGDQQDGTDREVDPAADHHESLADRQNAEDRKIAEGVAEIVGGGEARRLPGEDRNQQDENDGEALSPRTRDRGLKALRQRRRNDRCPRFDRAGRLAVDHRSLSSGYAAGHGTESILSIVTL